MSICSETTTRTLSHPLVDGFGRRHTYLRVSVTDRCNLRCFYCTPPEGVRRRQRVGILSFEEIARVARVLAGMGVRKIRITGGEPTVRKDIERLIEQLASLPGIETVAMTTNGVLLKDKARALRAAGLTALNISLDTLKRDCFERITQEDRLGDVIAGIAAALEAGFVPLKLNVVVISGVNDGELLDFIEFVRDRPINVRFIEYMPFKANEWNPDRLVSSTMMMDAVRQHWRLTPLPKEGSSRGVAEAFRIDGFLGTVSFISPMSESFCSACSRVRLTADGFIKSCLFTRPEAGLRDLLRDGAPDEALANVIRAAMRRKPQGRPPVQELSALRLESMWEIGG